jgi:hypothetical protein
MGIVLEVFAVRIKELRLEKLKKGSSIGFLLFFQFFFN